MRIRNLKNANEIIDNCQFLIKQPQTKYFNNNNPIILEIGMGKGQFLLAMALKNPQINFIGVEKYNSVIARAISKISSYNLTNLLLLREDAYNLGKYFSNQINTIHLNFSDPWPKKRQAKRRLSSQDFLKIYDKIGKNNYNLILKTDNQLLFESSILELNNFGYKFTKISLDLAHSDIENELTEYEEKFMKLGMKINYLNCFKDDNK